MEIEPSGVTENPVEPTPPGGTGIDAGETPPVVEQAGSRQGAETEPRGSKGGPSPYQAQLRVQRRLEDRLGRLEQSIGQIAQTLTTAKPPVASSNGDQADQDFWSNPKGEIAKMLAADRESLLGILNQTREQEAQKRAQGQNLLVADQYLAKLGEFNDDDYAEMREIARDPEIASLAVRNPERAAKLVYMEWSEQKGGSSPASQPRPSKVQASGVIGNAPGLGPKNWTMEEIAKVKGDPVAWRKNRDSIRNSINARASARMRGA